VKTISQRQSVKILCVDDNQDLADSEADLLRAVGYTVQVCYDAPTALDVAKTYEPCVCLLDLNMPGMDGDELAVRLREQAGDRPLVLVAVTAMSNDPSRRRTSDFDDHLVKPVAPLELIEVVDDLSGTCEVSPRSRSFSQAAQPVHEWRTSKAFSPR
jgi:two-component system OmpR family response regulator